MATQFLLGVLVVVLGTVLGFSFDDVGKSSRQFWSVALKCVATGVCMLIADIFVDRMFHVDQAVTRAKFSLQDTGIVVILGYGLIFAFFVMTIRRIMGR